MSEVKKAALSLTTAPLLLQGFGDELCKVAAPPGYGRIADQRQRTTAPAATPEQARSNPPQPVSKPVQPGRNRLPPVLIRRNLGPRGRAGMTPASAERSEKTASGLLTPAAELLGLGILAKPSLDILRGRRSSEKGVSGLELAGLGVLAAPSIIELAHARPAGLQGLLSQLARGPRLRIR